MKVQPINKKFGKYLPGETFELPDKAAKLFIKVGKLVAADNPTALSYQNRMMTTNTEASKFPPLGEPAAPYGYKTDGTPRKRPGRPATVSE